MKDVGRYIVVFFGTFVLAASLLVVGYKQKPEWFGRNAAPKPATLRH